MTISSENNVNRYTADGVQTAFTGTFKIYDQTHVKVLVDDIVQTLGTDYTVSGVGTDSGFTVTFTTAPASGKTVTLLLNPPHTQLTDYTALDPFPAETHERALDLLTQQVLKLKEKLGRLIGFKEKSTYKDITVDDPVAGRFLRWKADLSGLENIDISQVGALAVSDYIRTLLDDPDSATAAATLDLSNTTDDTKGDALIGFKQSGAGAVGRTVHDKLGEIVSVKDFGAKGDGVSDDTAAIQAAINSLPNGGIVYMPPGDYKVSATLLVHNGITLQGSGLNKYTSRLVPTAAVNTVIKSANYDSGGDNSQIILRDFYISGSYGSLARYIEMQGYWFYFENLKMEGANDAYGTFVLKNGRYAVLNNVVILNQDNSGGIGTGVGIKLDNFDSSTLLCDVEGASIGIDLSLTGGCFIRARLESCTTGIKLYSSTHNAIFGTFSNCPSSWINFTLSSSSNYIWTAKESTVGLPAYPLVFDATSRNNYAFSTEAVQDNNGENIIFNNGISKIILPKTLFADGDTTPSVRNGTFFYTGNTSPTTITYFDDGTDGQCIIVKTNDGQTTIQHNVNFIRLAGSANVTLTPGSTISFIRDAGVWFELSRSII